MLHKQCSSPQSSGVINVSYVAGSLLMAMLMAMLASY